MQAAWAINAGAKMGESDFINNIMPCLTKPVTKTPSTRNSYWESQDGLLEFSK